MRKTAMRKNLNAILLLSILIVILIFLASCASEETKQLIKDINSVNDVSIDSRAQLREMMARYDSLSNEQRGKVSNYQKLEEYFAEYENIVSERAASYSDSIINAKPIYYDSAANYKAALQSIKESIDQENDDVKERISLYNDGTLDTHILNYKAEYTNALWNDSYKLEQYAITVAENKLKSVLKNPNSYTLLSKSTRKKSKDGKNAVFYVELSYTASNSFGGILQDADKFVVELTNNSDMISSKVRFYDVLHDDYF